MNLKFPEESADDIAREGRKTRPHDIDVAASAAEAFSAFLLCARTNVGKGQRAAAIVKAKGRAKPRGVRAAQSNTSYS